MMNSVILVLGRITVDTKALHVLIWAIIIYLTVQNIFIMIKSFVFAGLSRNRCMSNLNVLKSSFFISEFIFCFVVEITGGATGGSIKF